MRVHTTTNSSGELSNSNHDQILESKLLEQLNAMIVEYRDPEAVLNRLFESESGSDSEASDTDTSEESGSTDSDTNSASSQPGFTLSAEDEKKYAESACQKIVISLTTLRNQVDIEATRWRRMDTANQLSLALSSMIENLSTLEQIRNQYAPLLTAEDERDEPSRRIYHIAEKQFQESGEPYTHADIENKIVTSKGLLDLAFSTITNQSERILNIFQTLHATTATTPNSHALHQRIQRISLMISIVQDRFEDKNKNPDTDLEYAVFLNIAEQCSLELLSAFRNCLNTLFTFGEAYCQLMLRFLLVSHDLFKFFADQSNPDHMQELQEQEGILKERQESIKQLSDLITQYRNIEVDELVQQDNTSVASSSAPDSLDDQSGQNKRRRSNDLTATDLPRRQPRREDHRSLTDSDDEDIALLLSTTSPRLFTRTPSHSPSQPGSPTAPERRFR